MDGSVSISSKAGVPMAAVQMIASIAAIGAAYYEYTSNMRAMRNMRAFLVATKYVFCGFCLLKYDYLSYSVIVHTLLWSLFWQE